MAKIEKISLAERLASQEERHENDVRGKEEPGEVERIVESFLYCENFFDKKRKNDTPYDVIMDASGEMEDKGRPRYRLDRYVRFSEDLYGVLLSSEKHAELLDLSYKELIDYLPIPFADFGSFFTDHLRILDSSKLGAKNPFFLQSNKEKWGPFVYQELNIMRMNPGIKVREVLEYKKSFEYRFTYYPWKDFGDYIGLRQAVYIIPYFGFWLPMYEYCKAHPKKVGDKGIKICK